MSRQVVVNDASVTVDGKPIAELGRDDLLALSRDLASDLLAADAEITWLRKLSAYVSFGQARLGWVLWGERKDVAG